MRYAKKGMEKSVDPYPQMGPVKFGRSRTSAREDSILWFIMYDRDREQASVWESEEPNDGWCAMLKCPILFNLSFWLVECIVCVLLVSICVRSIRIPCHIPRDKRVLWKIPTGTKAADVPSICHQMTIVRSRHYRSRRFRTLFDSSILILEHQVLFFSIWKWTNCTNESTSCLFTRRTRRENRYHRPINHQNQSTNQRQVEGSHNTRNTFKIAITPQR